MTAPGSHFRTHIDLSIHPKHRTDENKRQDIFMLIMIHFFKNGTDIVSWPALQRIWPVVLRLFKKRHLEFPGFYKDISSRRYSELDNLFFWLADASFGEYFLDGRSELHLQLSPRACSYFISKSDPEEVRAVTVLAPKIMRLYKIAKRNI